MPHPLRPVALGLLAVLAAAAAAAEAPLLKPAVPAGGHVRVRFPLKGGPEPVLQFVARGKVTRGGSKKKDDTVDCSVSLGTVGRTAATDVMLKKWGYNAVPDQTVIIPELVLTGVQVSPKLAKGADATLRVPNVKVRVIDADANGKSEQLSGTDLLVMVGEITGGADRVAEPRLYFTDRLFDLSPAAGAVRRPGTGDGPPADPPSEAPPGLTPFAAPLTSPAAPAFTGATINGTDTVKAPGKPEPLVVYLSASTWGMEDFYVSLGAALPLGLDVDLTKTGYVSSRVRELRLAMGTGPGYKARKEFLLTDAPVTVNLLDSGVTVAVGPTFINKHFPDAVYTVGPDGAARLFGRVDPKRLADAKPAKKK